MFVIQDNKVYMIDGKGLIGVDIYPDKVLKVRGTRVKPKGKIQSFSLYEIRTKYNVSVKPYKFPKKVKEEPKKEVKKGGTTRKTKKTSRTKSK